MIYYSNNEIHRVIKSDARKYYNAGFNVYVLPCKVRLDNCWIKPYCLPKNQDFDKLVAEYSYYNCNNELGHYCSFFIKNRS